MQTFLSLQHVATVALFVVLPLAGCGGASSGADVTTTHSHESLAETGWSEKAELFFEYEPLIAGVQSEPWAVHLTLLDGYKPVSEGVLTLAFRGLSGKVFTTRVASPVQPGIFTPAPLLEEPGQYDLVIEINGEEVQERFRLGQIEVYAGEASVPLPNPTERTQEIAFLKEQQWSVAFGVLEVKEESILNTINVTGDILPAAGHMAVVAAPISGLAEARKNLAAPAPGDRVRAGQTLVVLSPTAQDNSFAQTRANVQQLEREVDRLQRLFAAEAIPERRLIEATKELEVARAELDAMGGNGSDSFDYAVKAPLSGSVQTRRFTPGQRVEAGETLFEIVDPRLVWLHLHVPARHAALVDAPGTALFTVEGSSRIYQTSQVVSTSSIIDPETRTLPVILTVENADGSLKIGQFASAHLDVGVSKTGIAIPNEAILNEDGQPVVYVQTGGESFERRVLTLGTTDGLLTLAESGILSGDRVVTEGGYQVYLASLSASEITDHGHAH